MNDNIATAPRNYLAIKKRRAVDLCFQGFQKAAAKLQSTSDSVENVLLVPTISSKQTLTDLVNRLAWYLPEPSLQSHTIFVPVSDTVQKSIPDESVDYQPLYDRSHLNIEFAAAGDVPALASQADLLLCHDVYRALGTTLAKNLAKVVIVDATFYSGRSSGNWLNLRDYLCQPEPDTSQENFQSLTEHAAQSSESILFATGPSLKEAYSFDFSEDQLKIICNSIVKNDELLSHIQPDVLVFADPVFHFGPSNYAHEFRQDAVKTITKYDCFAVMPASRRSLLVGQYPEIKGKVIGIPVENRDSPTYPTLDSLSVMGTGNIMTLLMLPIASSLTDQVHIIGADGREEDESYFWEHSDEGQYDDELMQAAVDCHPAFFRDRIYTDYYQQHVQTLEEMIAHGERRGLEYTSLTESYMECLRDRYNPNAIE